MTNKELANKVDAYVAGKMPWWDYTDDMTCIGATAAETLKELKDYFGDDLDKGIEKALEEEVQKEKEAC